VSNSPTSSVKRTEDRYTILGYVSTAAKHGLDKITVLRDALTRQPWMPALPAPT
jgi:transposase